MKNRKTAVAVFILICLAGGITMFCNISNVSSSSYAGTVNGSPIDARLFKSRLQNESSATYDYFYKKYQVSDSINFWSTSVHGETPIEFAKKNALDKCVEIMVQQELARSKGILENTSYSAFLSELKEENARRKEAVKKGEIIYGPVQYSEKDYFEYRFTNMVIKLKEKLQANDFKITEKEIQDAYYQKKSNFNFVNRRVIKIYIPYSMGDKNNDDGQIKKVMEKIRSELTSGESIVRISTENKAVKNKEILLDNKFTKQQYIKTALSRKAADSLKAGDVSELYQEEGALCVLKVLECTKAEFPGLDKLESAIKEEKTNEKYRTLINDLIKAAKIQINEEIYKQIQIN